MKEHDRHELSFWEHTSRILDRMLSRNGGVLCTVVDAGGNTNVLTLGWGLIGPLYHGNPILAIAVAPPRYSWHFLEETGEFAIAVPDDGLRAAVDLCGSKSGRHVDKWSASGLTPVPSARIRAPSILECPINIECRVYTKVAPPHSLLTPEHRKRPLEEQHTIYFAEVLGAYRYS